MRVLQLYNRFGAMTERTMLEVPLALAGRGIELAFSAESVDDPSAADALGLPIHALPRIAVTTGAEVDAELQRIAEMPPAVSGECDLIHGHFGPRLLHALRWTKRGTPAVISCYGYDTSRLLRDETWARRYRWAGEHGVTFVVLSLAMAATLRGCGVPPDRVRVIPLGIDLTRWRFNPQPTVSRRFLFVGRPTPKKGLATLLHAVKLLAATDCEVRLDVVGGSDSSIRRKVADLGIEQSVELHPAVPYEQLGGWMRRAVALVAPSEVAPDGDAEGCPMVLMQAQAVGTPAITTRHAGNAEALPPLGQVHVVPERDPAALAAAMRAMLALADDEREALRVAGRAWVEQWFDLRSTVDRYEALYREVSGE